MLETKKSLGERIEVQTLKGLDKLSKEELKELRMFYLNLTGIPQKENCTSCYPVWAKMYRNHYNASKKLKPFVDEMVVHEPTEVDEATEVTEVDEVDEVAEPIENDKEKDYSGYKLSELREMFPNIKSKTKKGFIEQIEK